MPSSQVVRSVSPETSSQLRPPSCRSRGGLARFAGDTRNSGLGDASQEMVQSISCVTSSQLRAPRCLAREVVQRVPLEILATVGSALPHAMWSGQFRLRHSSQPWVRRCLARGGPASFASGVARAARRHTRELTPSVPGSLAAHVALPTLRPNSDYFRGPVVSTTLAVNVLARGMGCSCPTGRIPTGSGSWDCMIGLPPGQRSNRGRGAPGSLGGCMRGRFGRH